MMPKISIIIPVHNSEKYLKECINSLLLQSLREIQIIFVLNGSSDGSHEILKDYADKDPRIELIIKEKADLGGARNTGVNAASGEYLMFVDSDDWIKPEACEKLYSIATKHDLEILQADFNNVPDMIFKHFKCRKTLFNKKLTGLEFWRNNKNLTLMNWDKLWKRDFFITNCLYNPEGIYFEDGITTIKGFVYAKSFMITDYSFYFYRKVSTSIMNQPVTRKHIESSASVLTQIKSLIDQSDLENEKCVALMYYKNFFIYHAFYNRNSLKFIKNKIRSIDKNLLAAFPLKEKLSYYFPILAAMVYPIWRKRAAARSFLKKTAGTVRTLITPVFSDFEN